MEYSGYSSSRRRQAFHLAADDALGFPLPHDWTGEVRVVGVVERDGEIVASQMKTWQLHETAFFADYDVRGNADIVVRGD